jgi:hypothetical protein
MPQTPGLDIMSISVAALPPRPAGWSWSRMQGAARVTLWDQFIATNYDPCRIEIACDGVSWNGYGPTPRQAYDDAIDSLVRATERAERRDTLARFDSNLDTFRDDFRRPA